MENRICQLCSGLDFSEMPVRYSYAAHNYSLIKCRNCSLIMIEPMPSLETIKNFYVDDYFVKDYKCGVKRNSYYQEKPATIEKANQVLKLLNNLKPRGTILEIGCAGGIFLDQALKKGYKVEGVEISSTMSKKASELYGVKIRQGDFEKLEFMDGSFDIVCMFDVFEHFREPRQALEKIYRILKSRGIVMIDIPTTKNALAFKLSTKILKIAKKTREISSPPYHLHEYVPSTLQRFLRLTKFELYQVKKYATPPWRYLNENGSGIKKLAINTTRYLNYLLSLSFKIYTDRLFIIAQKQ